MTRKLTISIDDRVYDGLHAIVGKGNIGKFLEDLARPLVVADSLSAAYAEMAADRDRETEADEWCEALVGDGLDAPGEVWQVSFAGSSGGEVQKTRPAVIISNDAANQHANRVQIVPFSSKIGKLYPCDAIVTVEGTESKAMADQIATVTKERLLTFLGVLSPHDMHRVEMAIRIQLGLAA